MCPIAHSNFLDSPPDQDIDHQYLTDSEIIRLAPGVFYKKKAEITRHRFAQFVLTNEASATRGECVDDCGYWRAIPREIFRMANDLAVDLSEFDDETDILSGLGLLELLLPSSAPLPDGSAALPKNRSDMTVLYSHYTDMVLQGHFDEDSPDLDRLELLTSWVPRGARVLDMGCNSGGFGPTLVDRGCEVHGVELSGNLVVAARKRGVIAVQSWAEETPYPSCHFDVVICAELLEHVLDPIVLLTEARRILRPNGLLVGSVPHGDGPWGHRDIGHHPEHLRAFGPLELETQLLASGFKPTTIKVLTHGTSYPIGLAFRARSR